MITTPAFPEPNHTQTPNKFFEMIPSMNEAELRVTLVMIRQTFGFHRDGFKMGITKLAKAAGLSPQGARDGAAAAEKRGTFRRANPESIKESEWELVTEPLQPVDPSSQLIETLQPVEGDPLASGGQSSIKESIKETLNKQPTAGNYQKFSQKVTDERKEMLKLGERIEASLGITPDWKNKKWERATREIVKKEAAGQPFDKFVKWLKSGNEYNRPKPFQIAKDPTLILNNWAQAFMNVVENATFTRNEDGSINV